MISCRLVLDCHSHSVCGVPMQVHGKELPGPMTCRKCQVGLRCRFDCCACRSRSSTCPIR